MRRRVAMHLLTALALAGCAAAPARPPTAEMATPGYWLEMPAVASVSANEYDALWQASQRALRAYGFEPALADYRMGELTSEPLVAAQLFEFWRPDNRTLTDAALATVATLRRTVVIDIREDGNGYVAQPRVLIEREARRPARATSAQRYRALLSHSREYGTPEVDRGVALPDSYWYAIGRDEALERDLAGSIRRRLR